MLLGKGADDDVYLFDGEKPEMTHMREMLPRHRGTMQHARCIWDNEAFK